MSLQRWRSFGFQTKFEFKELLLESKKHFAIVCGFLNERAGISGTEFILIPLICGSMNTALYMKNVAQSYVRANPVE